MLLLLFSVSRKLALHYYDDTHHKTDSNIPEFRRTLSEKTLGHVYPNVVIIILVQSLVRVIAAVSSMAYRRTAYFFFTFIAE